MISIRATDPTEYTTQLVISDSPPPGERWSSPGITSAARRVCALAYRVAAVAAEEGVPVSVTPGESWGGGACATVTLEHDGAEAPCLRVQEAAERLARDASVAP